MKGFCTALLVFCVLVCLTDCASQTNDLAGVWQLDRGGSKFEPGPGPAEATLTIHEEGGWTYEQVNAEGQPWKASVGAGAEGEELPVTVEGAGSDTELTWQSKVIDDRHRESVFRANGQVRTRQKMTLSDDGQTLTIEATRTDADGNETTSVSVYRKTGG